MALVPDQKFSTFQNGGDLVSGDIVVGLRTGLNTRFTYTGALPPGVIVPIANGGTGASNASAARTNLGLGTMAVQDANAVAITGGTLTSVSLVTSALGTPTSGVLTNATGLPLTTGVTGNLPVTNLNSGTSAGATTFWRGDGTWSIPAGTGVTSVTGTANRITSTGGTTPVINIDPVYVGQNTITTVGALATGSLAAGFTPVTVPLGGTGNTTFTAYSVICAGTTATGVFQNVVGLGTAGEQLTSNGPGLLPTWQTGTAVTPSALTRTDDTNVTITLGGSPSTALLQATSLTMGWTGQLGLTRGGTAASLTASNGGIVYSNATTLAILAGTATANQILVSGSSAAPSWSTATFPVTAGSSGTILRSNGTNWVNSTSTFADTYTASNLLYSNGANTVTGLATANNGVLITSAGGVPSISSTLPSGIAATNMNLTTPTLGVASATSITFGGTALANYLEGTFTPTLVSAGGGAPTYTLQQGQYTRIGNRVYFNLFLILATAGTLAAGAVTIAGLPIAAAASCSLAVFVQTLAATAITQIMATTSNASSSITLSKYSAGAATDLTVANTTATSQFVISGNYIV